MPRGGELWLVAGIVLLILEVAAPGAFMMWLGIAAIGTGILSLAAAPPFWLEVAAFAGLAAAAIGLALWVRRRGARHLNTPESGLVGRTAVALAFRGRDGRVRVGDSDWPARLTRDAGEVEPGWMMEVAGVDGVVLVVRKKGEASARDPVRAAPGK